MQNKLDESRLEVTERVKLANCFDENLLLKSKFSLLDEFPNLSPKKFTIKKIENKAKGINKQRYQFNSDNSDAINQNQF